MLEIIDSIEARYDAQLQRACNIVAIGLLYSTRLGFRCNGAFEITSAPPFSNQIFTFH